MKDSDEIESSNQTLTGPDLSNLTESDAGGPVRVNAAKNNYYKIYCKKNSGRVNVCFLIWRRIRIAATKLVRHRFVRMERINVQNGK